ncbi:restriction endonuclease subunit S [Lacticaseibacillus paracasei]|uniref:restriction endonuclease subunit S n=1 Tax=Lacticaseibacillus paracasei TaxID=1597 RepID=UPI00195035D8|nr:restriction endonuclease subunit S [Lacticaseibacillus paracasei]MBM6414736.1 restriction endonuclease subunit S [Lacticaseibacillus paracasei]
MNANQAKYPQLRFKGFTDPWEQRKLGEEAQLTMGQSPNSENYTKNPDDYILVQGNADMKNGRVVPRVWTTQITKKAEKSDLILSVRAPVGDIGKTDYDVVLGRGVAAIKGNEFIFQQLGKMKLTGYWTRYSTGSTFESINSNDIKDAKIMVPVEEEQQKIGSFFQQLDHLITLHQCKLTKLKELKQGYLQKMFPKNGSKFPQLRFAGFADAWEKRKVSDYLCESRIPGSNGLKAKKLTVKLWGKGVVPKNETYSGSIKTKYYVRSANQLIYGKLDFLHAAFGIVPQSLDGWESTIDSPAFDVNTSIGNAAFLLALFLRPNFYLREGIRANGSRKAKRIHEDTFLSMSISAPQRKEQDQIAMVLDKTELLIAATQHKVDLLKKLKQGYLQKMFC